MRPLIIYHGACRDGFCAAWVAHRHFKGEADFIAANHGDAPPDVDGRDVFILDFSYPRAVIYDILKRCHQLTILDHHKTAEADLKGIPNALFNLDRSGAGIAWSYFQSGNRVATEVPWLVSYVEDRDLWRWKLPASKAVNAWIGIIPFTFESWYKAEMVHLEHARELGHAILEKMANYVAEVSKNAIRFDFEGYNIPVVNAPQVDISELLESLVLAGDPLAMGWWQRSDGMFSYSLRSRNDIDVSALAKRYGGGGHPQAAGFQTTKPIHF